MRYKPDAIDRQTAR